MVIELDYKPRPLWRDIIHPALESHRFSVLVCHRRFGKTVGTVNHAIKMACTCKKTAPMFAYIAPFRYQAKLIAWAYLKHYVSPIPNVKINESELYIELPSMHKGWHGARIYIVGADHPDGLRGTYWDGVILDEYAQIKKELWDEILRPALSDREGWAVIIGTPKGQNQFYDAYKKAVKTPSWFSCLYRVDESGVLPESEIKEMMADMTDLAIRQELYCDFTASASDVVIPIDLVTRAAGRLLIEKDVAGQPYILGVDVARFGDDSTVITARRGLLTCEQKIYKGLDTMTVADRVIDAIREYKPVAVFIDVGAMGAGVVDRLRQLHYNVTEVAFSGASTDGRYFNKRAEMYFKCKEWLELGGAIPDDTKLRTELSMVEYSFTTAGKIILESKEKLKERIGKSPDLADSLVLTFALPVSYDTARENDIDDDTPYDAWAEY